MKQVKNSIFLIMIFCILLATLTFAIPSPNWYQENGYYRLKDSVGNAITRAWICDDMDYGKPWYLLDNNGNMAVGLVCDSGKWYLLGDNGKLKFDNDCYYGIYLDIDHSTGVIKNKSFPLEIPRKYVSTTKIFYTSSFNNNDDIVQFSDNVILDYDTAVAFVRQLVGESRIEGITGDSIRVIGTLPIESILIERSRDDIICAFINLQNPNDNSISYQSRTAKNIEEAINRLNRFVIQKK